MGKSSGTNTVQQQTQPWQPAGARLQATADPLLNTYSQAAAIPQAQPLGLTAPGADQLSKTIGGYYLNGNPYLDSMIRATNANIGSQFEGSGRYGSGAYQDALANAQNQLRYNNYASERGAQQAAIMAAPTYDLAPYALYGQQVQSAFDPITRYQQALLGMASAGQAGSTSTPMYQNLALQALGGLGAIGSSALAAKNLGLFGSGAGAAGSGFGATNLAGLGVGAGLYDVAPGAYAAAAGATGGIGADAAGTAALGAGGKTLADAAPAAALVAI